MHLAPTTRKRRRARRLSILAGVPLLAAGLTTVVLGQADAATTPAAAAAGPALFDDFRYSSASDANLRSHGWTLRNGGGGPGVSGASWSSGNISFPTVDGNQVLQLKTTTDGSAAGTVNSEISRSAENALAGTYVARIKFADKPVSGPNGDHVVQTFFAISSVSTCDPSYSEADFSEYLPNGGYGGTATFNSQTSWAGGGSCRDFVEKDENRSFDGWHTIMATISGGHVKYYADGTLLADHSGAYYPRRGMSIDFNQWIQNLTGHCCAGRVSVWNESVDYVFFAPNQVLTQAQAVQQVTGYRNAGQYYVNTAGV